jgi:dihydroneopterin aldolase
MTRLLISVTSADEALLALEAGADVIDGKDVRRGALGALDPPTLRRIVRAVASRVPVSATAGDLPANPEKLVPAVEAVAATGVDWVKIGFYPGGDWQACLKALAPLARDLRLVGMLLADLTPAPERHVEAFAEAGFSGVMLDTAGKAGKHLTDVLPLTRIEGFVAAARAGWMSSGLAGSLTLEHVDLFAPFAPAVLGFRGAACDGGRRLSGLDASRVVALATRLADARETARAGTA